MVPDEKKSQITKGAVISAVPLVGYGLAFLYELGYGSHFRIPGDLINVGLVQVFVAISALFAILIMLFVVSNLVYIIAANVDGVDRKDPVVRSFSRLVPLALILGAFLLLYRSYWVGWVLPLVLFVIYACLELAAPLITQRRVQGYHAKLEAQEKHEEAITTLPEAIARKWGLSGARVGYYLIMFTSIAFCAGHAEAVNKEHFHVVADQKNLAIVRIYGDTVIAATYDPASKQLSGGISIQKLSPDVPLLLKQEKVGPLRAPTRRKYDLRERGTSWRKDQSSVE